MNDRVLYEGDLFEVVHRTKNAIFTAGEKEIFKTINYELVQRPPGIRAIIVRKDKILLACEYRYELDAWDYRLPGGKVYDSIERFHYSNKHGELENDLIRKLKEEILEEVDIEIKNYQLLNISHSGLTVNWDLYYYLVEDFITIANDCIQKTEYEYIKPKWFDFSTAMELCLNGSVSETRSAFEILKFILKSEVYQNAKLSQET